MEDEYKVVCALSNCATFNDLEWPRTPILRSQYSLKANISQTVHPIHSMFGSSPGFSGSADRMSLFAVRKNPRWRPSWIYKHGHNFATSLSIDVMFTSRIMFSGSADIMMPLLMTLSDPEPQFHSHSIVYKQISRRRCIRSTPCLVLGKGFQADGSNGAISGSIKSKMEADGRPSWNDGAVARKPCVRWAFLFFTYWILIF